MDFLLVTNELFSRRVTAEARRAKIGILKGLGQYPPNFRVEGDFPSNHFLHG